MSAWRRWRPAATAVWVLVVVAAAVWVAGREWDRVAEQARAMAWPGVALGLVLTLAAKLLLGETARLAAARHGISMGRVTAVRLYNLSQLGKYVPGSVWQFVGRAVAYRDLGARAGAIRDALLTETLWVVGGAVVVGTVLAGTGVWPVVGDALGDEGRPVLLGTAVVLALALAAVVVALVLRRRLVLSYARSTLPSVRVALTLLAVWVLLGAGFLVIARAGGVDLAWGYGIGLFAVAYAVGFVVVLAPAGIGVREAVLTIGMLPVASTEAGLVVVVVARLVYIAVEVGLVGAQEAALAVAGRRRAHRTTPENAAGSDARG